LTSEAIQAHEFKKGDTMKTLLLTLILAFASFCGIAADATISTDQANIQGVWLAQTESQNGQKRNVTYQYSFKGDKVSFKDENGQETVYLFKLGAVKNLKLLILQPEGTPDKSEPVSVAYELDGDSLKIVVAKAGSRPTEISDKNDQELIVCKRKKP
jgi:uncharacterized protein (TIGR03067 family)